MKRYILAFFILTVCASAQRNLVQGGDGILTRRDSILQFRIDALTIKRMGDSIGYVNTQRLSDSLDHNPRSSGITTSQLTDSLNNIPRSIPYDSLRRVGRDYEFTAMGTFSSSSDTSNVRLFGSNASGGMGGGPGWTQSLMFQAQQTIVLGSISITHSYDTTTWRRRDTLISCSPDSIPAGALVWCAYLPASASALLNGTGAQIIRIYYSTLNSATGAYTDDKWKLPLILGIIESHSGAMSDHHIRVTLRVHEKVPGLVY